MQSRRVGVEVNLTQLKANGGLAPPEMRHEKKIGLQQLINRLNFLHFQNKTLLVCLKHKEFGYPASLRAAPLPCGDDHLECRWTENQSQISQLRSYTFSHIIIPDGKNYFFVQPEVLRIDPAGLVFKLPETCLEIFFRKKRRHACQDVTVQAVQNGVSFYGTLIDFNADFFHVQLKAVHPQTFQWINPDITVSLIFTDNFETCYSGEARIFKQNQGQAIRNFVLEVLTPPLQRFQPKEFRSTRQKLLPSPTINFQHPFSKKTVTLKVVDLSGSGFAVEEEADNSLLVQGMVIPEIDIYFANNLYFKCKAQVIYRRNCDEAPVGKRVKCGLVLLDMDPQQHVSLLSLLYQAKDHHAFISNRVDMEALWTFFFRSGFIYPKKYAFIHANKEEIKATYKKLYTQHPDIARHFIYQDDNEIQGHMAMLRFYDNTWLIHHHAATRSSYNWSGFAVLNQIGRFINDSHRLYSMKMDFVFCYFRPENKFPNHVFGGIARNTKDKLGCSLDSFAYFHFQPEGAPAVDRPWRWELTPIENVDLMELQAYYDHTSGGLMLKALNLEPGKIDLSDLTEAYQRLGLIRERGLFALKRDGHLKAVIMVNIADLGLNMSDLTNSITVIVINHEDFSGDMLKYVLSVLCIKYSKKNMPVLMYPAAYADLENIPYERLYSLWVLNMEHTDYYFRYLKRLVKFIKH